MRKNKYKRLVYKSPLKESFYAETLIEFPKYTKLIQFPKV